jgi:hypothetical protein
MGSVRSSEPRLGVDIGRVIIDGSSHPDGGDTVFFTGGRDQLVRTPAMPGVFEILPPLVDRFGGRVWLISKCGERTERRTLTWLAHHDFEARTGIPTDHIRFCRQRADKAIHCADLGITHFVDDRPDVLVALDGVVEHRFLFGPQEVPPPPGVVATLTWRDADAEIRATLRD